MILEPSASLGTTCASEGLGDFYRRKIELIEQGIIEKTHNLARLSAQRNTLNAQGSVFYY